MRRALRRSAITRLTRGTGILWTKRSRRLKARSRNIWSGTCGSRSGQSRRASCGWLRSTGCCRLRVIAIFRNGDGSITCRCRGSMRSLRGSRMPGRSSARSCRIERVRVAAGCFTGRKGERQNRRMCWLRFSEMYTVRSSWVSAMWRDSSCCAWRSRTRSCRAIRARRWERTGRCEKTRSWT